MAGVIEKKETAEQKDAHRDSTGQLEKKLTQGIIGRLDLREGVADAIDETDEKEVGQEETSPESEEESSESSETSPEEGAEESGDTGSEKEEEGEASETEGETGKKKPDNTQRRIDELVKSNKRLETEVRRLKEGAASREEETDPDTKTLSRIADRPDALEKLKSLKTDVMLAFKKETDPVKEKEYLALSEKIDKTISSLPQRFAGKQLSEYQAAVRETIETHGDAYGEKEIIAIHDIAKKIYNSSATLKGSVSGQAEAWRLAEERFSERRTLSTDRSKTDDVKRQNNQLKKKVSLDIAVKKSSTDKVDDKRAFHKAKSGTSADKTAFIKKKMNTDSLIPEEYR